MTQPLRLVFAGTPVFAVPALQALLDSEHDVVAVYTQPDRPAGRGRKATASPVKALAMQAGLPVMQPVSFKEPAAVSNLATWQADLMIVVAYGLLLPPAVLETPRLGCVNVHASLLPRWRGAAPVQRALAAGDDTTGVCIMQMDAGLDTGPVLLARTLPIAATDNAQTLSDKLAAEGAAALLAALPGIATGQLVAAPQPATGKTYARRLQKSEAWIDWQQPADHILCQIRAFNPWPVAQTRWQNQALRIWQAQSGSPAAGSAPAAGMVLQADAAGIVVATGAGTIRITQLQLPGKKVVSAADFVNAYDIVRATLS